MGKFLRRRDWAGLVIIAAATAFIEAYRAVYIDPRVWGALCASAAPPVACLPRAGLLWLQRDYLWGSMALALGLWSFLIGRPFALKIAAIVVGICGVTNYNATWSMIGAALGVWAWLGEGRPGALPLDQAGDKSPDPITWGGDEAGGTRHVERVASPPPHPHPNKQVLRTCP